MTDSPPIEPAVTRRRTGSAENIGSDSPRAGRGSTAARGSVASMYTADDFRAELNRVERKLNRLSYACIALALIIVCAIVYLAVIAPSIA